MQTHSSGHLQCRERQTSSSCSTRAAVLDGSLKETHKDLGNLQKNLKQVDAFLKARFSTSERASAHVNGPGQPSTGPVGCEGAALPLVSSIKSECRSYSYLLREQKKHHNTSWVFRVSELVTQGPLCALEVFLDACSERSSPTHGIIHSGPEISPQVVQVGFNLLGWVS